MFCHLQVPGLCVIFIGALIYSHLLVLPFSSRLENVDEIAAEHMDDQQEGGGNQQNPGVIPVQQRGGNLQQNWENDEDLRTRDDVPLLAG